MNLALSNCNEHVNPLVIMLTPFGNPEKLTSTLKQTKVEILKMKKMYRRAIKKTENNESSNEEEGDLIILGLLRKKHYV